MHSNIDITPQQLLDTVFEIDETAAVLIADKWGTDIADSERYRAAWQIAERQTMFPTCDHCCWPLVGSHPECETALNDAQISERDEHCEVEEDTPSAGEVYARALHTFGGNVEQAREAAQMYPGDFI